MKYLRSLCVIGAALVGCGARTGLSADVPSDAATLDAAPDLPPDLAPDVPPDVGRDATPDIAQPNVTCENATQLPPGVNVDLVVETAGGRERVSACEVAVTRGGPVRFYRVTLRADQQVTFAAEYLTPLPYARIYRDCSRTSCLAQTRVDNRGATATYTSVGAPGDVIVAVGFDYGTVAEVPEGTLSMRVEYTGGR